MTLTCEELAELIYDFVQGDLAEAHVGGFRVHIEGCPNCRIHLESYHYTVRLTRALPRDVPLPESLAKRLAAALREHLAQAEGK